MTADLFSLDNLSVPQRIERLRALAAESRRLAAADTTPGHRQEFLRIAENWEKIASDLEAATKAQ